MKRSLMGKDSCVTTALFTFKYLLVCCFVVMRDLLRWQRWNSPHSPWREGTQVHLQLPTDSPWRTLQAAETQTVEKMRVQESEVR